MGGGNIIKEEFKRYFAVSLIGFLVDLSVFSVALRFFGLSWFLAAALGFSLGALAVWWLSVRLVFKNRALARSPLLEFLSFVTIGVLGLGVTELVLWVGVGVLKMQPELIKLAAAGVTFLFNFVLRKIILFRSDL
jgi:putative flippase GtrA